MEIGIDIEKNSRFVNISQRVIERAFTPNEITFASGFKDKSELFCSYWCTKEAIIKAFGNRQIPFQEIEIAHEPSGKPYIVKNNTIKQELEKLNLSEIKISISHSKDYSTAVCLLY